MVGRNADVEDLTQEVFFQVFRSLRDFRAEARFTTWLHRVTVNVVLMWRRAQRSRPVFTGKGDEELAFERAAETDHPDELAQRGQQAAAFSRILDRLGDKKRDVFVLHELEGHSANEIAEMLGCPVLTVRTRLFYARREIEEMLVEEPALAEAREVARMSAGEKR